MFIRFGFSPCNQLFLPSKTYNKYSLSLYIANIKFCYLKKKLQAACYLISTVLTDMQCIMQNLTVQYLKPECEKHTMLSLQNSTVERFLLI